MYWVIALFDENTEKIIKGIWGELCENSISSYTEEVKDGRPHITLGNYSNLDISEYTKRMDSFYDHKMSIDITFNTIGSFLNYGTLFYSPTVTSELIEFHTYHHEHFNEFNGKANSLYLPGKWIPHCTLANRLSPEKLSEAFHFCLKRSDVIYGKIIEVALIELVDENNKCINAPIIFSKRLLIE
ncbi:2'-5' RNA ligase [Bacillus pakistanensis]|uniref:2'-5' RNA ligase n=1 Tax=Rossellomorea pakistanensis TaxID=992288 RepID=A0ABS2NH40_9BACI|nr:2'-5' RNA ligase [Bacillus pakistanensis]